MFGSKNYYSSSNECCNFTFRHEYTNGILVRERIKIVSRIVWEVYDRRSGIKMGDKEGSILLENEAKDTAKGVEAERGKSADEATNKREECVEEAIDELDDSLDELAEDVTDSREDIADEGKVATEDLEQGTESVNDEREDLREELRNIADCCLCGTVDGREDGCDGLADELAEVGDSGADDVNDLLQKRVNDVLRAVAGDDGVCERV